MISLARKHFFLRRAPAHFWASEFSTIPTARGDGVFGQGRVFGHVSDYATNSLLKNCFGSPFRAAKRRGTSLFVGFWRAVIPYCAHSSTFEILFQQAVSRVTVHLKENFTFPIRALSLTTPTVGRSSRDLVLLGHLYLAIDPASFWPSPRRRTYEHSSRYPSKCYSGPNSEIVTHGSPV